MGFFSEREGGAREGKKKRGGKIVQRTFSFLFLFHSRVRIQSLGLLSLPPP